jgi:hypothetical protein
MEKITLTNNFHNTSVNLIPYKGFLSAGQVKRAKRVLCGISGCCCGDDLGQRGPQEVHVEVHQDSTGELVGWVR